MKGKYAINKVYIKSIRNITKNKKKRTTCLQIILFIYHSIYKTKLLIMCKNSSYCFFFQYYFLFVISFKKISNQGILKNVTNLRMHFK